MEVVWRGMILGSTTVEPGEPFQWRSVDFQLATAPAVDDLRLRFTSLDGGDSNVRAAYVAVQREVKILLTGVSRAGARSR
jgi:hypothetical protein